MAKKIKKLIIITNPLYVRNYIQTNAFQKILDEDTYIACSSGIASEEVIKNYWKFSGVFSISKFSESLFAYVSLLLMYENRKINKGFYFYFKKQNITIYYRSINLRLKASKWCKNEIFRAILVQFIEILRPFRQIKKLLQFISIVTISFLGMTNLFVSIYQYLLPKNKKLDQIISSIKPDLVLMPNGGLDPVTAEVMNLSKKKYDFKTMLLIDNWDNLSSKSRFAFVPDFLCVWGEQTKGHAINYHDFNPKNIFIAGTPRYDVYTQYKNNKLKKDQVNKFIKKSINFPYILFAGCWPKFDEIEVLVLLNALIDKYHDLLPEGCKILYRPHPWGENYDKLDFLNSMGLDNIEIDPQMSQKSRPNDYRRRTDFQPNLDYYPSLLDDSEFVICPLASIIIEASIMHKNILILAHDDKKNLMNPSKMYTTSDYFDRLEEMQNNRFLFDLKELDSVFHEMLTTSMYTDDSELNYYIVNDGTLYPDRIKDICDSLPLFIMTQEDL
jgi:hypothetical protein